MDRLSIKKLVVLFFIANVIAIGSCVVSGYLRGNIAFRFEEKQAITVWRKERHITIKIPENFDVTVLECSAETSAHDEFYIPSEDLERCLSWMASFS